MRNNNNCKTLMKRTNITDMKEYDINM